jgi:hypothetical protein
MWHKLGKDKYIENFCWKTQMKIPVANTDGRMILK